MIYAVSNDGTFGTVNYIYTTEIEEEAIMKPEEEIVGITWGRLNITTRFNKKDVKKLKSYSYYEAYVEATKWLEQFGRTIRYY
jgi:hypothetical protein